MAENKTKITSIKPEEFIAGVKSQKRREDALVLLKLLKKITGKRAKMWGPSIIGFDKYRYQYESGHSGEICMIGFSPRAASQVLYIMPGFSSHEELLKRLGKYTTGKSCLYIKRLDDVDMAVLESLLTESYLFARSKYA